MLTHLSSCPERGRTFADRIPGNIRCTCFVAPKPVIVDAFARWERNVNLYVTWITPRTGRDRVILKVHDAGSVPGTAYFGRRKALEILCRNEPSVQLWVTNNAERAASLANRHPVTRTLIETRNAGLPKARRARAGTRVRDAFPGVSVARGGIRYPTATTLEGAVDPVTGVSERVLDETAGQRRIDEILDVFFPPKPDEAARSLGLTPPKPKADPDDFVWRKSARAESGPLGKVHVAAMYAGPTPAARHEVALCTYSRYGERLILGRRDESEVEHEGRCRRCLHYINATGGALPPDWDKTTEGRPTKKEFEMDSKTRAAGLRSEADRLLERAAELESRPSEPDVDEEGNAVVWFRVWFREGDEQFYDYALIRTTSGKWYSTGAERAGNGASWEQVVDHFYDHCERVEVWQATEFVAIGTKP